jgi:hypothetical protein
MDLVVSNSGQVRCIYSDSIPLSHLGKLSITRASHVESNSVGQWMADLSPVDGPLLGPFEFRTDALAAEVDWLRKHWLLKPA